MTDINNEALLRRLTPFDLKLNELLISTLQNNIINTELFLIVGFQSGKMAVKDGVRFYQV